MTTCILSRFGFGVADTRGTMGDTPLPSIQRKIFVINDPLTNLPHTLVASSGSGGFESRCRPLRQPLDSATPHHLHPAATPESTLEWLIEYQYEKISVEGENRTLLVANSRQKLFIIDNAGCMSEVDDSAPFWAIGSGSHWALGYLQGIREYELDKNIRATHFERAIVYASYYDTWTGPQTLTVTL